MLAFSSDGMHEVARVLFHNKECQLRFGALRPLAANAELMQAMPAETKTHWRHYFRDIYQVSQCPACICFQLTSSLQTAGCA